MQLYFTQRLDEVSSVEVQSFLHKTDKFEHDFSLSNALPRRVYNMK